MPSSIAYGKSCVVKPSSASEQSIPFDSTPRSLPFLIFLPPGSMELCSATGTKSFSCKFCAPVTICSGSPAPTSIWQIQRWSESGCLSSLSTCPTTTFSISLPSFSQPSTLEPLMVIASVNARIGISSSVTNSFSHLIERFIVLYHAFYIISSHQPNCLRNRTSFS